MNHHAEYYAKKKLENFDKSTVFDQSTIYDEEQDNMIFRESDHPINWPKITNPLNNKWFNVIVVPACVWAALAWLNAQYNIGQGDLKPHSWELMNAATAVLFMYWSAKLFELLVNINYTKQWVEKLAKATVYICSATFIWFGLVLVHTVFEFVINLLNK